MLTEISLVIGLHENGYEFDKNNENVTDIVLDSDWLQNNKQFIKQYVEDVEDIEYLFTFCDSYTERVIVDIAYDEGVIDRNDLFELYMEMFSDVDDELCEKLCGKTIDHMSYDEICKHREIIEEIADINGNEVYKEYILKACRPQTWLEQILEGRDSEIGGIEDNPFEIFEDEHFEDAIMHVEDQYKYISSWEYSNALKNWLKKKAHASEEEYLDALLDYHGYDRKSDEIRSWLEDWFDEKVIDAVLKKSEEQITKEKEEQFVKTLEISNEKDRIAHDIANTVVGNLGLGDIIEVHSGYVGAEDMTFSYITINGEYCGEIAFDRPWINGREFGDNEISVQMLKDAIDSVMTPDVQEKFDNDKYAQILFKGYA